MKIKESTRFLVVDDTDSMRKAVIAQLCTMGWHDFVEARTGAEALEILKKNPIDVILCDQEMPLMSGLELLNTVRNIKQFAKLPFLLITSSVSKNYVLDAIRSGVSNILVKPYSLKLLTEHIENAINCPVKSIPVVASTTSKTGLPIEKSTILVVDDIPDNLKLLAGIFRETYRVQVAQSGAQALEICTADKAPDLVLLDIMMPEMDGFEVATRMRQHPNSENIPIIFVSAMEGEDVRLKGMKLGAMDFVSKPVDPDALKIRVDNFMRYVELHKQLQSDYDSMLDVARLQTEIESIIQHDAKTPLSNLLNIVQMMRDDAEINNRQLKQLKRIEEMALESVHTINFSSELYKIENSKFKYKPITIDIDEILRRLVDISHQTFQKKHITIQIETNFKTVDKKTPQILGDALLCYSLFDNLINCACEYAPENSFVTVSMDDNEPVKFTLTNQGIISATDSEHFFDKYINNQLNRNYSAKLFAEIQNGSLNLDCSKESNTTIVTLCLPKAPE
jgi:CheY-like chemotaxis protein